MAGLLCIYPADASDVAPTMVAPVVGAIGQGRADFPIGAFPTCRRVEWAAAGNVSDGDYLNDMHLTITVPPRLCDRQAYATPPGAPLGSAHPHQIIARFVLRPERTGWLYKCIRWPDAPGSARVDVLKQSSSECCVGGLPWHKRGLMESLRVSLSPFETAQLFNAIPSSH